MRKTLERMRIMQPLYRKTLLLTLFLLIFAAPSFGEAPVRHIVLLPSINYTEYEVWESKYYPVNVLEHKMTDYLASLLRGNPFTDVSVLDGGQAERWMDDPTFRQCTFAVRMELHHVIAKQREVFGSFEKGDVSLRVRIYNPMEAGLIESFVASGKDQRYTFDPGDDQLFLLNTRTSLIDIIYRDGLDFLRLSPSYKGQKMSRPTWAQFSSTPYWQAFKNAIDDVASGIANMKDGELYVIGRIISPTANSTKKNREYIITLGKQDAIAAGDILQVIRGDTYVTVDPENPVVVLSRVIGNVKVIKVMSDQAIVRLVNERKNDPVQLNDLITAPPYGKKKVERLR
ncbi:MAG: hypothetical protein GX181_07895 [Synergistaceae bacterium]|nr:hypothetical protein [Synergistaceae bacterium]